MMLLVVFVHSLGFVATDGHDVPHWFTVLDKGTDFFRMPVLVALAGALVPRALRKRTGVFITGKLRAVVWPYALWATLTMTAILGYRGVDAVVGAVLLPGPYLWFSWALIIGFASVLVLRNHQPWILPAAAVFLAASAVVPLAEASWAVFNVAFFLLGWWLMEHRGSVPERFRPWLLGVCVTAAGIVTVVGALQIAETRHAVPWSWGGVSVLVILFLCAPSRRVPHAAAPLEWVGRNSMVFYSSHALIAFLLTRTADRIGTPSLLTQQPLLTGIGTFVITVTLCAICVRARRFRIIELAYTWPTSRRPNGGEHGRRRAVAT